MVANVKILQKNLKDFVGIKQILFSQSLWMTSEVANPSQSIGAFSILVINVSEQFYSGF